MLTGYTAYVTYILESTTGTTTPVFGGSAHCNYIKKIHLDDLNANDISIKFNSIDDFKFLNSGGTGQYGFYADKFSILLQIIDNSQFSDINNIKPISSEWRKYDVTNQISEKFPLFNVGDLLSPEHFINIVFNVPVDNYVYMDVYNLNYLNYPSSNDVGSGVNKPMMFGEEQIFLGNVSTDIAAIAYTAKIEANMPANEFNSSNNLTWDGNSDVYISEIGIYDENNNLIGIGKFNNPIRKNTSISRTILFELDF